MKAVPIHHLWKLMPGVWVCVVFCFFAEFSKNSWAETTLEFDVNFVVLTQNPALHKGLTLSQVQSEVDILNTYFVGEAGERPVRFRFKNASFLDQKIDPSCKGLMALGDFASAYDGRRFKARFDDCKDSRIADPSAINFYVYDSYEAGKGFLDITSHGHFHAGKPLVVMDWERLGHRTQSPEEHEMGHAFGLDHVCAVGATLGTPTNIMASHDCGRGSGGQRNIGFNASQIDIIRSKARVIWQSFQKAQTP